MARAIYVADLEARIKSDSSTRATIEEEEEEDGAMEYL